MSSRRPCLPLQILIDLFKRICLWLLWFGQKRSASVPLLLIKMWTMMTRSVNSCGCHIKPVPVCVSGAILMTCTQCTQYRNSGDAVQGIIHCCPWAKTKKQLSSSCHLHLTTSKLAGASSSCHLNLAIYKLAAASMGKAMMQACPITDEQGDCLFRGRRMNGSHKFWLEGGLSNTMADI